MRIIEDEREKFLEYFHQNAEAYLETLEVTIRHLRKMSYSYCGFDFSDEVDNMVMNAILENLNKNKEADGND